MLSDAKRAELN